MAAKQSATNPPTGPPRPHGIPNSRPRRTPRAQQSRSGKQQGGCASETSAVPAPPIRIAAPAQPISTRTTRSSPVTRLGSCYFYFGLPPVSPPLPGASDHHQRSQEVAAAVRSVVQRAMAAPPTVRGYGPASPSSSVALPRLRSRVPASLVPVTTQRASSVRLRAAVADAPRGGLQLQRREEREEGLSGTVFGREEEDEVLEKVGEEKVEGWMRESIAEIVRHIGEAPFLVHLFSSDDGEGERVTVRREPAAPESWPDVRRRWGPGGQRRPDGIILVEQVAPDGGASASASDAARQVWGLVVQARGMECASCYVLDTCRVRSSAGSCTHFCLARVQCFGDPLELQLRNAWLNRLAGRR